MTKEEIELEALKLEVAEIQTRMRIILNSMFLIIVGLAAVISRFFITTNPDDLKIGLGYWMSILLLGGASTVLWFILRADSKQHDSKITEIRELANNIS